MSAVSPVWSFFSYVKNTHHHFMVALRTILHNKKHQKKELSEKSWQPTEINDRTRLKSANGSFMKKEGNGNRETIFYFYSRLLCCLLVTTRMRVDYCGVDEVFSNKKWIGDAFDWNVLREFSEKARDVSRTAIITHRYHPHPPPPFPIPTKMLSRMVVFMLFSANGNTVTRHTELPWMH